MSCFWRVMLFIGRWGVFRSFASCNKQSNFKHFAQSSSYSLRYSLVTSVVCMNYLQLRTLSSLFFRSFGRCGGEP